MRLDLERERAENKMWIESSNPSEEKVNLKILL